MEKEFKIHRWNVYKFDFKTKKSKLLGSVNAKHQPDALLKGWNKFRITRTHQELKGIYVRRK
jgi:hypothetical protein